MLINPTASMHIRNVDSSKTRLGRSSSSFWSPRSSAFTPVVIAMIPSSGPNSKAGKRFRSNHIRFAPRQSGTVMVMRPPGFNTSNQLRASNMSRPHAQPRVRRKSHRRSWLRSWQSGTVFVTIGSDLIAVDIDITFLVENPAIEVKFHLAKIRRVGFQQSGWPRELAAKNEISLYDQSNWRRI